MTLLITLTVRRAALEDFRAFETKAAEIMAKYGGAIERTLVLRADATSEVLDEVHVVTFPDEQAFAAYRADAELGELSAVRERAIVSTDIRVGDPGPTYGFPS